MVAASASHYGRKIWDRGTHLGFLNLRCIKGRKQITDADLRLFAALRGFSFAKFGSYKVIL